MPPDREQLCNYRCEQIMVQALTLQGVIKPLYDIFLQVETTG